MPATNSSAALTRQAAPKTPTFGRGVTREAIPPGTRPRAPTAAAQPQSQSIRQDIRQDIRQEPKYDYAETLRRENLKSNEVIAAEKKKIENNNSIIAQLNKVNKASSAATAERQTLDILQKTRSDLLPKRTPAEQEALDKFTENLEKTSTSKIYSAVLWLSVGVAGAVITLGITLLRLLT